MRTTVRALLVAMLLAAGARGLAAEAVQGSHLSADDNNCTKCHGEDVWEGDQKRLYVPAESLANDVHFKNGVNCHDCHGGDPASMEVNNAHSIEAPKDQTAIVGFRSPLGEIKKVCENCHKEQVVDVRRSVHAKAGEKDASGHGTALACTVCHGEKTHGMRPVKDPQSPVFLDHQVKKCGSCHEEWFGLYKKSVHGFGLYEAGLTVTAGCADCHGAHGIYYAANNRSTLFTENVAGTCGKCHRFIEERLMKSVHGRKNGPGYLSERAAPGGKEKKTPTCTDCHQGHDLQDPKSAAFRLQLPNRCGNCHSNLSQHYNVSMHGELTELGYGPGAKCSDCHGSHDILPPSEAASGLSPANRLNTCKACHPHAVKNFAQFDPHADQNDPNRYPLVHGVYVLLLTLLFTTFGVFGLHSVLWFTRSLIDVLKHGRPKALVPGAAAYVRFAPSHRWFHAILLISFLGLALTGLPLKYSDHEWAKRLAFALGGFAQTSVWHRIFGLLNFACLGTYIIRLVASLRSGIETGRGLRSTVFGPDSPVPNFRDVKDFFKMIRWFCGLGPKPTFERWSYWEKFDFWGAGADIVIIGFTGLILWFPNIFCSLLPGVTLNIAKVIHSTQALLATGFVFAIHFFNTHFRVEKFPADMSILTGLVSEEELKEERPDFFARMQQEGRLEELRRTVPPSRRLWAIFLLGALALAVGLSLLVGIIAASLGG